MKRDMDLVRSILLKLEQKDIGRSVTIDGFEDETVSRHLELLEEAGLIKATIIPLDNRPSLVLVERPTWQGYDFLDAIRSDQVWNRTKTLVAEKTGSTAFEVIKAVATAIATKLLLG